MGSPSWVEQWLSAPRFAPYLAAAGTERGALELYEWNAAISAAVHHDIAHVEVGLRNAYDRALCASLEPGAPHWVFDARRFFPADPQRAANGRVIDANETARHQDVLDVAALIAPELAIHVKATSTVPRLIDERPC